MSGPAGLSAFSLFALADLLTTLLIAAILFKALPTRRFALALLFFWGRALWSGGAWAMALSGMPPELEPGWEVVSVQAVALALLVAGVPASLRLIRAGRPPLGVLALALASGIGAWLAWGWHLWSAGRTTAPAAGRHYRLARDGRWSSSPGTARPFARDTILSPNPASLLPGAPAQGGLTLAALFPFALVALAGVLEALFWRSMPDLLTGDPNASRLVLRAILMSGALLGAVAATAAGDALRVPPGAAACAMIAFGAGTVAALAALDAQGPVLAAALLLASAGYLAVDPLAMAWLGRDGRANAFTIGLLFAASWYGVSNSGPLLPDYTDKAAIAPAAAAVVAVALVALPWAGRGGERERSNPGVTAHLSRFFRDPLLLGLLGALVATQLGLQLRRQSLSGLDGMLDPMQIAVVWQGAPWGAVAGGWLANRMRSERGYVGFVAGVSALGAILNVVAALTEDPSTLWWAMLLAGLTAGAWYGPLLALFQWRAESGGRVLYAAIPSFLIVALLWGIGALLESLTIDARTALIASAGALFAAALIALVLRAPASSRS